MTETASYGSVEEQIEALGTFYRDYAEKSAREESKTTGLARIGEWFAGSRRFANDTMHTKFYEGVQERVARLTEALAELSDTQAAARGAQAAVAIILNPIPEEERDVGGWMRFAAEPLCLPLLVYLPREVLEEQYRAYNRIYPKRLQFPTQVKLRKEMERLLRETERR